MREAIKMWTSTRMIMLTAVSAAVYAAVLIAFKFVQIVPGFASLRIGNMFPPMFALMFGPAGAWGAAIGNAIADVFGGTLTLGSFFGFFGNFFLGYTYYKLWGNLGPLSSGDEPFMSSLKQLGEFWVITLVAASVLAAFISWGLTVLGFFPFVVIAVTALLMHFIIPSILTPPVMYLVYPRVKEIGLLYPEVMDPDDLRSVAPGRQQTAAIGILAVALVWEFLGIGISVSQGGRIPYIQGSVAEIGTSQISIIFGAVMLVLLLGFFLMAGERLPSMIGLDSGAADLADD
jgi:energy-coupling factor transport system substrate-specific component